MPSVKSPDMEEMDPVPKLSEEEQQSLLTAEIEKSEKLATSQLNMAQWFLAEGKIDIARRRLQQLIESLPLSESAKSAQMILKKLAER